ncbi:MAG: tRNA (N6-isopentenyl adenosine(37)-C2)-methylthiotransferase MiaB [Actinobacteria bacterium]|nr:tRNA (N6-isopentenyl adenosine(37)-C2)-methylthiotransferase MiaB [Actinomycetota bacterium]
MSAPDQKRYLIRTHGCQMNAHDSERIAGLFEADGMVPTDSLDEADVVVLNTCCIRENADNKLYGTLGHLKSLKDKRPELEIVVGGCLAQKDRELIQKKAGHVDVVFGTHNVHRAVELLDAARTSGPLTEILDEAVLDDNELFPTLLPTVREIDYLAWVTIQIGCDNNCAFCIVPSVRGTEISKPFGTIVDEVRQLAASGVTEVTLLGQNVNSFGRDIALKLRGELAESDIDPVEAAGARWAEDRRARSLFADLLREVGAVEGIRRVRYTSPHPKDFREDTIAAMAETAAVCEHLHLPLQSGSDRILAAMHRGYTADRYLAKVAAAREGIDDLALTTDVIIGFPGETDRDFHDTLEVFAEVGFDAAYTFIYSPRPGTEAAEMTDRFVDHAVSVERMNQLRAVLERSSRQRNEARIGRIDEVIVEGPSKRNPELLTGRTRQNKLVHFASPEPIRPGTYALVEITGASLSNLAGELREIVHVPTHRTRIPLLATS